MVNTLNDHISHLKNEMIHQNTLIGTFNGALYNNKKIVEGETKAQVGMS